MIKAGSFDATASLSALHVEQGKLPGPNAPFGHTPDRFVLLSAIPYSKPH